MLGQALGDRFLTARAGLVVVPDALDQPIARVDARDLAGWLVQVCGQQAGAVNATGPAGMTTFDGLLGTCREVTGGEAEPPRTTTAGHPAVIGSRRDATR